MGIQLLTPDKVKSDSRAQEDEKRRRNADLDREEERLVKSVNVLREEEKDALRKKEEREAATEGTLGVRATVLHREVESLEARKAAALEPIDRREQEFRAREDDFARRDALAVERDEKLRTREENVQIDFERAKEKNDEADERIAQVKKLEIAAASAAEEVSRSTANLSDKWVEFHAAVAVSNTDMEKREALVKAGEEANTIRATALDEREKAQDERDRELTDRSQTLEASAAEIFSNKQ